MSGKFSIEQNSNLKARLFIDKPAQSIEEINSDFSQGVLLSGESYPSAIHENLQRKSKIIGRNLRLVDDIGKLNTEKADLNYIKNRSGGICRQPNGINCTFLS